jgi:AcrR family transcriptional regulator
MVDEAAELPRGIALAWGVAANPQRGPRRELSLERIVEAAIRIADDSGLAAVSMASVATALGFTTMSLYRYVTAKDDLILLMQEVGMGPPHSMGSGGTWRDGLGRWYRASLEMYAAHPWILDIPISSAPNTPNNLAWLDAGLAALTDTPLDDRERVSAMLLVSGQSRWEAGIARGYDGSTDIDSEQLAALLTPEEFPYLYPAVLAGAFDSGNPFDFGVSRVLDGLERYMEDIAAGRPAATSVPAAPEFPKDESVKKARSAIRDAETRLRDAHKREREAIAKAREREAAARERDQKR